jgi:hypothetical protein
LSHPTLDGNGVKAMPGLFEYPILVHSIQYLKKERILSTFYMQFLHQYSFDKKLERQAVTREKLRKTILYQKACINVDENDTLSLLKSKKSKIIYVPSLRPSVDG